MFQLYLCGTNKILILGEVGCQCDQITASSWSGNTYQPTITQPITLIRILFGVEACQQCQQLPHLLVTLPSQHARDATKWSSYRLENGNLHGIDWFQSLDYTVLLDH